MALISDAMNLDREYSPSVWSQRFATPHEVLHHHVGFVTAESEKAINTIPHKLEIEYGSTDGQKLDILGTDLPDDSPILVFIHGGYWQELSRELSRYPALTLHRAQVKTVVVGYDLCPAVTLPEIIDQVLGAARFVFEYAEKMNSRGVYFAGHSAGAHLVAKLLANADFLESVPGAHRLQGAFLISGVYDLREMVQTYVNEKVQLPVDWAPSLSPQFDHYTHLRRGVRIYILAGQNDSPTFKRQSREFYELLHNTCLMQNMYLEIKDDMDHFDIVECFAKEDNYMRNLLVHDIRKHLATASNASVINESTYLNREYDPGVWSKRFATSKEAQDHHIRYVTSESEKATNTIPSKLDIKYGSTDEQALDILGTDLPDDSPILVFIHGGFWQLLSRNISRYPAPPLHRANIKTIVVGYDLCPDVTLCEIIDQISNAARFVFDYAEKINSSGVYFAGHSAGGHLFAELLANKDFLKSVSGAQKLQGAFLLSGVYDLTELIYTNLNRKLQLPAELALSVSPLFDFYTGLRKLRVYVRAGQNDSPTFKRQSREFYTLLCSQNFMNIDFAIEDSYDHFEMVECFTRDDNYMKKLLVEDIRKHLAT